MVPDAYARRRLHCLEEFNCTTLGRPCPAPDDDDDSDEALQARLLRAFAPLLDPATLVEDMRPCGPADPEIGDAVIGLPTLYHRGPGTLQQPVDGPGRAVVFFSVRPKFSGERARSQGLGAYDPAQQVNAAWLVWRCQQVISAQERRRVLAAYEAIGHPLTDYDASLSH